MTQASDKATVDTTDSTIGRKDLFNTTLVLNFWPAAFPSRILVTTLQIMIERTNEQDHSYPCRKRRCARSASFASACAAPALTKAMPRHRPAVVLRYIASAVWKESTCPGLCVDVGEASETNSALHTTCSNLIYQHDITVSQSIWANPRYLTSYPRVRRLDGVPKDETSSQHAVKGEIRP